MGVVPLIQLPPQEILPDAVSYLDVPFGFVPGFRLLRLDLHIPKGIHGPVPVVVYASGGAWQLVMKHHGPWTFLPGNGYAVAVVEYRGSGEARFPSPVHDLKAAIRFLRRHAEEFGLDPERIAGWGSSAGAYLVSLSALTTGISEFEGEIGEDLDQPSALRAVIDHYGISDLVHLAEDTNDLPGVSEPLGTDTSPETLLLGSRPDEQPELAKRASPVTYANSSVPFLIMHGDADTRIGIGQSRRLFEALENADAEVEFHVVPGADHVGPEFFSEASNRIALEFLNRHLAIEAGDPVA